MDSNIKSGQRGHINGFVKNTDSHIKVDKICLRLDHETAWALCNLLCENSLAHTNSLEIDQIKSMSSLGSALGRLLDHPSANNGNRKIVK